MFSCASKTKMPSADVKLCEFQTSPDSKTGEMNDLKETSCFFETEDHYHILYCIAQTKDINTLDSKVPV